MASLTQSALLFEASAKFQNASGALELLALGKKLEEPNRAALEWSAVFLSGPDSTKHVNAASSVNNLAVQATQAKPSIYASILDFRNEFVELGLNSRESISGFLTSLHDLMSSGGESVSSPFDDDTRYLHLASKLLHGASDDLLNQVDVGKLPERPFFQGV